MPSLFFSGTRSGTGGVLAVSFNSKDQSVFYRVTKQTGWNDKINNPTFAGGETVSFKLSQDEVGDIIHAVNGHDRCGFFHTFNNENSVGDFHFYEVDDKKIPGKKIRGFGLILKKGAFVSKIGFSLGSAERLSQYLQFALQRINEAIYAQDKKEAEEYLKRSDVTDKHKVVKKEPVQKEPVQKEPVQKEPVQEEVPDEPVVNENVNPPEIVEGGEEDSLNW